MSRKLHAALLGLVVLMVTGAGATAAAATPSAPTCRAGEFCLWAAGSYRGPIVRITVEEASPGQCVPLPEKFDGRSFANLTTRPVTVYQGRECSTEGEFDTYPGGGTYVPDGPYVVRGIQIWES